MRAAGFEIERSEGVVVPMPFIFGIHCCRKSRLPSTRFGAVAASIIWFSDFVCRQGTPNLGNSAANGGRLGKPNDHFN
jgi:hypothetical protein